MPHGSSGPPAWAEAGHTADGAVDAGSAGLPAGWRPLPYQPAFEQAQPDEAEAIAELERVLIHMAQVVAVQDGEAHRAVHAKGHALLRGRLQVLAGLPPPLAQGLFAEPRAYDTVIRFSSPPAELLPDDVGTVRAVALKVLDVPGARLPDSPAGTTQDFLMVSTPVFPRAGPQGFLQDMRLLAATTGRSPRAKQILSAALRGVEAAIEAIGGEATRLRGAGGQPLTHPLGERFFAQVPFLYGDYMARFSLVPVSRSLTALAGARLDSSHDDAQREAIRVFFAPGGGAPAEWELQVQLCTDLDRMPIEDASVEWDTGLSPYLPVARLTVGAQASWTGADSEREEQALAFDPWHALAAHRPLGGVNRARRVVMAGSRRFRSDFNRCPIHQPGA
jgi:hypothetical protein